MSAEGRCSVAVLAAGLGTRMKSARPKVLHELLGRPMLAYVLDAAHLVQPTELPIVVYSPASAAITEAFADRAAFALQEEPLGTGDAVRAALGAVPDDAAELLVLSGDVPLVNPGLLLELLGERRAEDAVIALVGVEAFDPTGLGRIVRDGATGLVERIVEEKDAADEELKIEEINAGIYAFDVAWLRDRIADLLPSEATGELYLTELVRLARSDGRRVVALSVEDDGTLLGINDRVQLAVAAGDMRYRINAAHMRAGVTIEEPDSTWIEAPVELAPDVVVQPDVRLAGRTRIGAGTVIRSGSQIVDSSVGAGCVIWASIVDSTDVPDGAIVGPFAHLHGRRGGPGERPGGGA